MTRVLVADDDPHIRELVRLYLDREGFEVREAAEGRAALALFDSAPFDLALVDVMMPGLDGWEVCREIRERSDTPVVMLTAKGEMDDKLLGFSLGADDYVVKPFAPPELVARIKALLKRFRIATSQVVEVGEVRLDRATRESHVGGEPIPLAPKEFELLFYLASYPNRTVPRERLLDEVWGYDYDGDERTLDVHVKRLRDHLPRESAGFSIGTVRGLGYRLEVEA